MMISLQSQRKTKEPLLINGSFNVLVSPRGVTQSACRLPSCTALYRLLGPLAIKQFAELLYFRLRPFGFDTPRLIERKKKKRTPKGIRFSYWYRLGESNP